MVPPLYGRLIARWRHGTCFYLTRGPTGSLLVFLYSAVSSALHFASRPVHSDTNSASPKSILAGQILPTQQLYTVYVRRLFTHISTAVFIAMFSCIQLSELERMKMHNLRNGSKRGLLIRAHLIASPAFYR